MATSNGLINKIAKNLGSAAKSLSGLDYVAPTSTLLSASTYGSRSTPNRNWLFNQGDSGIDICFSYSGLRDIKNAYELCPAVYSIVNQQAYTFITGTTEIQKLDGTIGKGPWVEKLKALLKNPNPLQNWKQFEAQLVIFVRLFGSCIILPIIPVGYTAEDATALWIIPPYMVEYEFNETVFYNVKGNYIKRIIVKYGEEEKDLPVNSVWIIRDITPGFSNVYIPGSPVKPLQENINNLIALAQSKGSIINHRGALGILTPEIDPSGAISGADGEDDDLQDALMQYGLLRGQRKIIVANAAMKWQQIGSPNKDLMLTEWAVDETMVIADGLTFPYKLLAGSVGSSLPGNEIDAWKKKLYVDWTIPYADMIYEQISEEFMASEKGFKIVKSFKNVKILQDDDLKNAQARKSRNDALLIEFQNNMLTLNQWLDKNGEPALTNGYGDKFYYELAALGWAFAKGGVTVNVGGAESTATTTTTT